MLDRLKAAVIRSQVEARGVSLVPLFRAPASEKGT